MSNFWDYFYFKKISIKYVIIFYNNKFYLIYNKANLKFLIFKYIKSSKIINISNNLFIYINIILNFSITTNSEPRLKKYRRER